ncbi:unnamed protein product [Diatraea saccharalis]|uniref:Phospholipid scramblase n=1 Tax=Diatraea saccharalis TaxID=40085 RepID=A0A9N9RHK0_9NEOP|nr:unnamed protein product [Diatraea saccharalis]
MCSGNKYVVFDFNEHELFNAKESGSLNFLGGKNRAWEIIITDMQDNKVISLRRPYTFGPDKMEVKVCNQVVSIVRQKVTFMKAMLNINDPQDRLVLKVKAPAIIIGECDFEIFTPSKQRIGVIRKLWGGWAQEAFSNKDYFNINFPTDLDVRYKAAIIGTCLLIDFLYYES